MIWDLEWHDDWPGKRTSKLEQSWLEAWKTSQHSNIFQNPVLARIWVESVGRPRGEQSGLLVARSDAGTLYWPLTIRTRSAAGFKRRDLSALGGTLFFDYQDPFVDGALFNTDDWIELIRAMRASLPNLKINFAYFQFLTSTLCPDIQEVLDNEVECDECTRAPYINLAAFRDVEQLISQLPKNQREKIRRKRRAALEHGMEMEVFTASEKKAALESLKAMISAYSRQHGSGHRFEDPFTVEFYNQVVSYGLSEGWLHFSVLKIADSPVHWHVGFLWNRRLYWYKPCYGVDDWNLSPGHLHITYLLEEGFREGWEEFDFTVGKEPYKYRWTKTERPVFRLAWFSRGMQGTLFRRVSALRHRWTRVGIEASLRGAGTQALKKMRSLR